MFRRKLLFILSFFIAVFGFGQNQKIADSLRQTYELDTLVGVEKLDLLKDLAYNERRDFGLAFQYSQELIELSTEVQNNYYLSIGYLQRGNVYQKLEEIKLSLESFFLAVDAAKLSNGRADLGVIYMSIGNSYSELNDVVNADLYYKKSIEEYKFSEKLITQQDSVSLAILIYNLADEYIRRENPVYASNYLEEASTIFEATNHEMGNYYVLGSRGQLKILQKNYKGGKEDLEVAIKALSKKNDYYAASEYLASLSGIYLIERDYINAKKLANRSLEYAKIDGYKLQVSETSKILYTLDSINGNYLDAMEHQNNFIAYKDSVAGEARRNEIASLTQRHRVSQKQAELNIQVKENDIVKLKNENQQKTIFVTLLLIVFVSVLSFVLYKRYGFVKKTNVIISEERDKSDNLLLNILPEETAQELKQHGAVQAKRFDSVTVLFADFEGFTNYAEKLPPEELVKSIDYYFSHFDKIMEKYGLEKIKTVGDAYMCAAGLPFPMSDHPKKAIYAAKEIIDFVENAKRRNQGSTPFDIRIGLNTGSVVAGVVGTKKFAYDIWGDAVNIASRMESNSEIGRINVSENTYELIKDDFECIYRGNVAVKNKGNMNMYFVGEEISVVVS